MKPLYLSLEGFRSHEGPTEISFEERTFIAIVGPVGSGKSSILEAIAYALYGRAPSVGATTSKLISSWAESAEVVFEFVVDERTYLIERSIRQRGKPAATL